MTIAAAFAIDPWAPTLPLPSLADMNIQQISLPLGYDRPIQPGSWQCPHSFQGTCRLMAQLSRAHLSYPYPLHCFSAGSLVNQRGNNLSLPCPSVSQPLNMDQPLLSGLTHIHISFMFPCHCEPVFSRGRIMNVKWTQSHLLIDEWALDSAFPSCLRSYYLQDVCRVFYLTGPHLKKGKHFLSPDLGEGGNNAYEA